MQLISVIVPIYNTEKYLSKCLDSILAQTYTNWEAILVDDGSPDNCGKICDVYAAKDKRFKVIHQKNGGVSVARQTGLDNATGDYIIHCDPDDWIEPTMLDEMLKCAISNNADMVICDFISHLNGIKEYHTQNFKKDITAKELQNKIINQEIHGSCWNKLIKSVYCRNASFTPSTITYCEDELYLIRILCNNATIKYLPKGLYNYRMDNSSSICNSKSRKIINSKMAVISEIAQIKDIENIDNLYTMKKSCISTAFINGDYKFATEIYKDIHHRIIAENKKYNIFLPISSCLKIALKGQPRLAYALYRINIGFITLVKKIKHYFH